jgi:glyoxylase-like metal-dependent hydrolase (beta-lactamase superfamily II)
MGWTARHENLEAPIKAQSSVTARDVAGLHATAPQPLPFDPSLSIRAFLLERERGNLLVYSTGVLDEDVPTLRERGGFARQYLNHRHEALFGSDGPARELAAKLNVNAADAGSVRRRGWQVDDSFSRQHTVEEDFEVIPTPGHTPGATAYLWDSGQHRLLFTGDTIYVRDGEWVAAVLESSDRQRYVESLELLRDLEFDLLAPWAASRDGPEVFRVEPGEGRERIAEILARVRSGEDH